MSNADIKQMSRMPNAPEWFYIHACGKNTLSQLGTRDKIKIEADWRRLLLKELRCGEEVKEDPSSNICRNCGASDIAKTHWVPTGQIGEGGYFNCESYEGKVSRG